MPNLIQAFHSVVSRSGGKKYSNVIAISTVIYYRMVGDE